jgi:hypothetical protein
MLIAELNSPCETKMDGKAVTNLRMMVYRLVDMATNEDADLMAIKEVYDRVEGKAKQEVDVKHDGDVTVRSAAVSVLDEIIEESTRRVPRGTPKDTLPN